MLCTPPVARMARRLRKHLQPALIRATSMPSRAAASVRQSLHRAAAGTSPADPSEKVLRNPPLPASLGTLAVRGNTAAAAAANPIAASSGISSLPYSAVIRVSSGTRGIVKRMETRFQDEGARLKRQMSSIYQTWEQRNHLLPAGSVRAA